MKLSKSTFFDGLHDLLDVLLEAKVEHLIGFVEGSELKVSEVEVASVHVIHNSTASSDKDVDSSSELVDLILHAGASIDCKHIVLIWGMLKEVELLGNLHSKLSRRGKDHSLGLSFAELTGVSQTSNHRKAETEGLARSGKVSDHQVLRIVNSSESHVLNREKSGDSTSDKTLLGLNVDLGEVGEHTLRVNLSNNFLGLFFKSSGERIRPGFT